MCFVWQVIVRTSPFVSKLSLEQLERQVLTLLVRTNEMGFSHLRNDCVLCSRPESFVECSCRDVQGRAVCSPNLWLNKEVGSSAGPKLVGKLDPSCYQIGYSWLFPNKRKHVLGEKEIDYQDYHRLSGEIFSTFFPPIYFHPCFLNACLWPLLVCRVVFWCVFQGDGNPLISNTWDAC